MDKRGKRGPSCLKITDFWSFPRMAGKDIPRASILEGPTGELHAQFIGTQTGLGKMHPSPKVLAAAATYLKCGGFRHPSKAGDCWRCQPRMRARAGLSGGFQLFPSKIQGAVNNVYPAGNSGAHCQRGAQSGRPAQKWMPTVLALIKFFRRR